MTNVISLSFQQVVRLDFSEPRWTKRCTEIEAEMIEIEFL